MLIVAGFVAVLWTIFMLVSATGLLRTNNLDQVEPDGVWAGILAGLGPALWAYSLVSFKREDNGFRRTGLPGLVILGAPFAAAIQLASMLVWPLVVDKLMHGQTVIATYSSDPLAFGLAAAFVIAMYAWCLLCLLGMALDSMGAGLIGAILMIAVAGVGIWRGIRIFDNPPTETSLLVWAVIAVLGLVLLPVIAAVVTRRTPDTGQEYQYRAASEGRRRPRGW